MIYDENLEHKCTLSRRNEMKMKIKMEVEVKMNMKKMRSWNPNYDENLLVTGTDQVVAYIQTDDVDEFFILNFSHVNHHLVCGKIRSSPQCCPLSVNILTYYALGSYNNCIISVGLSFPKYPYCHVPE